MLNSERMDKGMSPRNATRHRGLREPGWAALTSLAWRRGGGAGRTAARPLPAGCPPRIRHSFGPASQLRTSASTFPQSLRAPGPAGPAGKGPRPRGSRPQPREAAGAHLTRAGGAPGGRGGATGLTWPAAWSGRDSSAAARGPDASARSGRPGARGQAAAAAASPARPRALLSSLAAGPLRRSRWKRS